MPHQINAAVIGVGQMGINHGMIYQKIPGVRLAAICEYNDERREEMAAFFGCRAYKDYRELLADPTIDAVSVVLPDDIHRECVELAVKYRKHILLEKPLAKELSDGIAMYEMLKDYEKVFTVGFLLRFDPRFNMIKKALDKNELGEIIHMYCRRNSPIIGPMRYIGVSDLCMHVMIHDIDYVNWFMGCNPVKAYAKGRSVLLKEYNMTDVIYALVTYENGALVCFEASWVLPEKSPTVIDDRVELVGTKGVVYIDPCDAGVRFVTGDRIQYPDSRHWFEINNTISGDLSEQIIAFINCILNGEKPIVTVKQALDSLRLADAIEASLRQGAEVSMV